MLWSDLVVPFSSKMWLAWLDVSKKACGVWGHANQTRLLSFELHNGAIWESPTSKILILLTFWSCCCIPIRQHSVLSEFSFNLSLCIHWLTSLIDYFIVVKAVVYFKLFPGADAIDIQLCVICMTMVVRKMWFNNLKKLASIERKKKWSRDCCLVELQI